MRWIGSIMGTTMSGLALLSCVGCVGDCIRHSDCDKDEVCRQGTCVIRGSSDSGDTDALGRTDTDDVNNGHVNVDYDSNRSDDSDTSDTDDTVGAGDTATDTSGEALPVTNDTDSDGT